MDRKKLAKRLIFLIFWILIVNFLANKFYWYFSIWYLDMIMHFLGGLWVGLVSIYLFSFNKNFFWAFKILGIVFFIGLGWELFEIIVNDVITKNPLNFLDISSDIFFDLAGGAMAILYFIKRIMLKLRDSPRENSLEGCP